MALWKTANLRMLDEKKNQLCYFDIISKFVNDSMAKISSKWR